MTNINIDVNITSNCIGTFLRILFLLYAATGDIIAKIIKKI